MRDGPFSTPQAGRAAPAPSTPVARRERRATGALEESTHEPQARKLLLPEDARQGLGWHRFPPGLCDTGSLEGVPAHTRDTRASVSAVLVPGPNRSHAACVGRACALLAPSSCSPSLSAWRFSWSPVEAEAAAGTERLRRPTGAKIERLAFPLRCRRPLTAVPLRARPSHGNVCCPYCRTREMASATRPGWG